jgi:hypothetical protein
MLSGGCYKVGRTSNANRLWGSQAWNICCRLFNVSVTFGYPDLFKRQNLKQFVPKDLFSSKRPQEWEAMIFKIHAQHIGKKAEDAQTEYLDIVKQWPFYGTTFYPPCKSIANRRLPAKVIIGVNAEGILLLKKDKVVVV